MALVPLGLTIFAKVLPKHLVDRRPPQQRPLTIEGRKSPLLIS